MFEKLFMLVKNNAGTAVVNNPIIPAKYHEAVINEASSSIIEVLKGQMENGKLKEMIKYFQYPGIYSNPLVNSTVNKFANKLNDYYGIEPAEAVMIAKELIPPVMQEMIEQSAKQNTDFTLSKLLSMLNGNYDMNNLLSQLAVA
ncbi:hypothetical protein [Mucilaginibacter sp. dw_454]|uniref:hypothetical protein n=1 Tax=Mucilaginibacter sp. dw_454 TaxID=2720079 RepID=UPI001BD4AF62|nr:hypothetical protein [Mucilaginibacter sp. dw_454]